MFLKPRKCRFISAVKFRLIASLQSLQQVENVIMFLKANGIRGLVGKNDWTIAAKWCRAASRRDVRSARWTPFWLQLQKCIG